MFFVFICNLLILWHHVRLNTKFWKEHEELFGNFSEFIKNHGSAVHFPDGEQFHENAKFLSLFKRAYIAQNLLKKDYKELQWVFEKFIPKKIHDEIGFRGYERIVLGTAVSKTLTIMFLDIMGFATASQEIHNPYRTLVLLNIYFDGIGEIVDRHGWYIDKYLWDGILIIFDQTATDTVLRAAIEIEEFIKQFQIGASGRQIRVGIGINRWEVTLGTIGTKKRMEATVIGEAVNIAARLEHLTRTYDAGIILSDAAYKNIIDESLFGLRFLADETIRWHANPIRLYGVDGFSKKVVSAEIQKIA